MKKRLHRLVPLLMVVALLIPSVTLAAISVPDSNPLLTQVDIYRHLFEVDDMLVIARYDVPYASAPDEAISQAYIGRYMNGSTELGRASPYPYYNIKGYDEGMFSIYLSAAEAPPWEGSYSVELIGSPTLDWLALTAETAMTGAVADDGGAQTDETTEANSAAANDMTLLPATPVVNDAYYLGGSDEFSIATLNIGTQGAGVWTFTWEYYDGDGWSSITGVTDDTAGFTATVGNHDVSFSPPDDWTLTTIQSIEAYWIRGRVSAYTSITTQPKGTQSWVNSGADVPSAPTSSLEWRSTSSTSATRVLLRAHLIAWASELGTYWGVALTEDTAAGTVLSSYGEEYFTNAIPGLRTMCPGLFSASITTPAYEDIDYPETQSEAIKGTWPFDWGGISEWFGLPSSDEVFRTIIGFFIILGLCAMIMAKTNRTDFSLSAGYGLLIAAAAVGWLSPLLVAGIVFLTAVLASLVFIAGKA